MFVVFLQGKYNTEAKDKLLIQTEGQTDNAKSSTAWIVFRNPAKNEILTDEAFDCVPPE